jgi:hypothetical protein
MRARRLPLLLGLAAVLSIGLFGPGLQASTPEAEWHALMSEDKAVQSEFPASPKYEPVQLISGQGFPYTMHQYVFEKDATVFQLQTAVYPKDVYIQPQFNIQAGLDSSAKGLEGGKWADVNWTRHQGHVAADAVGVRAGLAIRVFSLLKGQRLVTLTYVGPPDSARTAAVDRFIKSLKVM